MKLPHLLPAAVRSIELLSTGTHQEGGAAGISYIHEEKHTGRGPGQLERY